MNTQIQLEAASGYLYLGMPDECLDELNEVVFSDRRSEQFMTLRVMALIAKCQWIDALVAARMLRTRYPTCDMAYTAGAISLIEMARYGEAIALVLSGPSSLRDNAVTHLQIAYCEVQMGHEYAAQLSMDVARRLNPGLAKEAKPYIVRELPVEELLDS